MPLPLGAAMAARLEKTMKLFDRIARQARAAAERTIDRRNPLRARLIESAVDAALNQARADERERQAKVKTDRVASLARANATPVQPIRQQCQVVRKGPPVQIVGAPVRRQFVPPARRIVETYVS